jgi:hypothetical protein
MARTSLRLRPVRRTIFLRTFLAVEQY